MSLYQKKNCAVHFKKVLSLLFFISKFFHKFTEKLVLFLLRQKQVPDNKKQSTFKN